jgi:predicted permease
MDGLVREPPAALADMAAYGLVSSAFRVGDRALDAAGAAVTPDFFRLTGSRPRIGRVPDATEPDARVVVLSELLWRSAFGGDPGVLGRTVELFGAPHTVIAVLRAGDEYPRGTGWWVPARSVPASLTPVAWLGIGRLAPGASAELARQQFQARAVLELTPDSTRWGGQGLAAVPIESFPKRTADPRLLIASAGIAATVLIVLLNLANLMAVRVLRRGPESAVRAALGAGRWAIVRPAFAESMVLASAGVALAGLLAGWAMRLLPRLEPALAGLRFDGHVLLFAAAATLLCVAALALPPALHLARIDTRALQYRISSAVTTGRRGRRARNALVGAQVALSLVLVAALGILLKAHRNFRALDVGYDAPHTLVIRPDWPAASDDRTQRATAERLVETLGTRGHGRIVYWRTRAPDWPPPPIAQLLAVEGRTEELPTRRGLWSFDEVSDGFFEALGIPILEGRAFTSDDVSGSAPVVIISRAAADAWWPGESALGRRIRIGGPASGEPWLRVVGVVGDLQAIHAMSRSFTASGRVQPRAFRPMAQVAQDPPAGWAYRRCFFCSRIALALRPAHELHSAAERLRLDLAAVAPELGAPVVRTLLDEQMHAYGPANLASGMLLLGPFALLAAGLALLGIIGVVTDGVTRRAREIGIRTALGARRRQVVSVMARETLVTTMIGAIAGVAFLLFGAAVTRKLFFFGAGARGMLPGTGPTDPAVIVPAALIVLGTAAAFGVLAARRASRIDPAITLRAE